MLNALAIITIRKSSQMNSKTCYFVVLVQSVIDLTVGLFGIPLFAIFLLSGLGLISNCFVATLAFTSTVVLLGLSTIALIAMTGERYIAILHPYSYLSLMTKKRLSIFACCGAALEFPVKFLSLFVDGLLLTYSSIKITLAFVFIVFAYTRIYIVVRKQAGSRNGLNDAPTHGNLSKRKLFLQEVKHAKACFIVAVCFFVLVVLIPNSDFSFTFSRP